MDEHGISNENGKTIGWTDLVEVRFADVPSGRLIISELILKTESEKTQLQCNDRRRGEHRTAFLMLCRGVTEHLEARRPELRFLPTAGTAILAWGMALIGLCAIVYGLYYLSVGIADWGERGSGFAVGMGVGAMLFGVFLGWCGSPWEKPEPKTPAETREWIDRLLQMG